MKRTNIYLDEEQVRSLKLIAERRGEPMATLIREALDTWLEGQGARVIDEDEWQRRFLRLLNRRRRASRGLDPDEVMAEVNRAVQEVRRARAARRR